MSKAHTMRYHWSDATQRYLRCVAEYRCPYGDAHTDPTGMAEAGGAPLSTHGHSTRLTVSALIDGKYSMGTEQRCQVYDAKGNLVPRGEADRWKAERAEAAALASAKATDAEEGTTQGPAVVPTGYKPFELAEKSTDAGVLAMLASSTDASIRLTVARNPATATHTLEQLVLSQDKGWKIYRLAAREELSARYQDERDAAELEACARMERDGVLPRLTEQAPAAAVLATTPQKVWERKPIQARRSLIRLAMEQLGKLTRRAVRITGWTRNVVAKRVLGSDGVWLIELPSRLSKELHLPQITGWMLDFFGSLEGDAQARARVRKKLARSFGFA